MPDNKNKKKVSAADFDALFEDSPKSQPKAVSAADFDALFGDDSQKKSPDVSAPTLAAPSPVGQPGALATPQVSAPPTGVIHNVGGTETPAPPPVSPYDVMGNVFGKDLRGGNVVNPDVTIEPTHDDVKRQTAGASKVLIDDAMQNMAKLPPAFNERFPNPISNQPGSLLHDISNPAGDPSHTGAYIQSRVDQLEKEKQAAIQNAGYNNPSTAAGLSDYGLSQINKEYSSKISDLKSNAAHVIGLQLYNKEYTQKPLTDAEAGTKINALADQRDKELKEVSGINAAPGSPYAYNQNAAQGAREQKTKDINDRYQNEVAKIKAGQKWDATRLGIEQRVLLGDPQAKADAVRYDQGQPLSPDARVEYQTSGNEILKLGTKNAEANGQTPISEQSAKKILTPQQIEADNQDYFNTKRGNEIGNLKYQDENALFRAIVPHFGQMSKKDVKEYGEQLGYTPSQIAKIDPEKVPTSSTLWQQFARGALNTPAPLYENFIGKPLMKASGASSEDISQRFQPGWENQKGLGAAIAGNMPSDQNSFHNVRGAFGQAFEAAGGLFTFGGEVAGAAKAIKGVGLLSDVAKADHLANFGVMFHNGFTSAYHEAGDILGDKPEDEWKRLAYAVTRGGIEAKIFSYAPKGKLAQKAFSVEQKSAQEMLDQIVKAKDIGVLATPTFKESVAKKIMAIGNEEGKQIGLAAANEMAKDVVNLAVNPNRKQDISEDIKNTAASTAIAMIIPSIMGGINHVKSQTPLNNATMFEVGSHPQQYLEAADKQFQEGKINRQDLSLIRKGVGMMQSVINDAPTENLDGQKLTPDQIKTYTFNKFQQELLKEKAFEIDQAAKKNKVEPDKALIAPLEKRISELEKQRADILKNAGEIRPPAPVAEDKNQGKEDERSVATEAASEKPVAKPIENKINDKYDAESLPKVTIDDYLSSAPGLTEFGISDARENEKQSIEDAKTKMILAFKYLEGDITAKEYIGSKIFNYADYAKEESRVGNYAKEESSYWVDKYENWKKSQPETKKTDTELKNDIPLTSQKDLTPKTSEDVNNEKIIGNDEGRQNSASSEINGQENSSPEEANDGENRHEQQKDRELKEPEKPELKKEEVAPKEQPLPASGNKRKKIAIPIKANAEYNAWDHGSEEGKPADEVKARLESAPPDEKIGGGESFNEFKDRIKSAWEKTKASAKDNTLMITHSSVMRMIKAAEEHGWENTDKLREAYNQNVEPEIGTRETYKTDKGEIHLMRHGETEAGEKGLDRPKETPITKEGERQAKEEIAAHIKEEEIAPPEIHTDENKRTSETADIVQQELENNNRANKKAEIERGINAKSETSTEKMQRSPSDRVQHGNGDVTDFYVTPEIAREAYDKYVAKDGNKQSYETIIRRGGFSMKELDVLVPDWKGRLLDAETKKKDYTINSGGVVHTPREGHMAAFAEHFGEMISKHVDVATPYEDSFLKDNNLTRDQYRALPKEGQEELEKKWHKSKQFQELLKVKGFEEAPQEKPKETPKPNGAIAAEVKKENKPSAPKKIEAKGSDIENLEKKEITPATSADQNRKKGSFVKDGITYARNENQEGPTGSEGSLEFSRGVEKPFQYQLVESDQLQTASKDGNRNPEHFIPEAQPKDRKDAASKESAERIADNPDLGKVGESPNPYSGAPVVNARGEVIQGNNRGEGLVKHYENNGTEYKKQLAENAVKFGLTKEQVEGMKNPVLVRRVDVGDEEAIRLGNYDVKDIESGGKNRIDPVATSRRISSKDKESITNVLLRGDDDKKTLNQLIRSNFGDIFKLLKAHLRPAQIDALTNKSGEPSSEGLQDVEKLITHFLFSEGDVNLPSHYDELPDRAKQGLLKAFPSIFSTSDEKSILSDVQNAIIAYENFRQSENPSFDTWKRQADLFSGGAAPQDIFSPLEIKLAESFLKSKEKGFKPEDMKKLFLAYADKVNGRPGDMFGAGVDPLSKSEAVKEVFKVPYDEKQSRAEREKAEANRIDEEANRAPVREEPAAAKEEKPIDQFESTPGDDDYIDPAHNQLVHTKDKKSASFTTKEPIPIYRGVQAEESKFEPERGGFYAPAKDGAIGYTDYNDGKTQLKGHLDERQLKPGAKVLRLVSGDPENYDVNKAGVKEFERITKTKIPDGDITEKLWGEPEIADKLKKAGYDAVVGTSMDGYMYYLLNHEVTEKIGEKQKGVPESSGDLALKDVASVAKALSENKALVDKINNDHSDARGAKSKETYFHGTKDSSFAEKEAFKPQPNDETGIPGISFTTDKKEADYYKNRPKGEGKANEGSVVEVKLIGNDPIEYLDLVDRVKDELGLGEDDDFEDKDLADYLEKHNSIGIDYGHTIGGDEVSVLNPERIVVQYKDPESLARAYHYAKENGTNPELVKAVESNLAPADKRSVATNPKPEEKPSATKELSDEITALKKQIEVHQAFIKKSAEELKANKTDKVAAWNKHAEVLRRRESEQEKLQMQIDRKQGLLDRAEFEERAKKPFKKTADAIRDFADKIIKDNPGAMSTIIPVSPKYIKDFIKLIADGVEKLGNIHVALHDAIEWLKSKGEKEPTVEEKRMIQENLAYLRKPQKEEPINSKYFNDAYRPWADAAVEDLEAGANYQEVVDDILDTEGLDKETKAKIINYIDWKTNDRYIHNANLAEPQEKDNVISDYSLSNGEERTKYLSGETIEMRTNDKPLNDQQVTKIQLELLANDAQAMVSKMKRHFGDDVTEFGPDMIRQINKIPAGETAKRVTAVVGLMDELRKDQDIYQYELTTLKDNPKDNLRRRDLNQKLSEIPRMISQAEKIYQETQREASKTLNAGRIMAKLFSGKFAHEAHADDAILPDKVKESKKAFEEKQADTRVPDKVVEEGPLRKEADADKDVADAQEKMAKKKEPSTAKEKAKNVVKKVTETVTRKKVKDKKDVERMAQEATEKLAKKGMTPENMMDKIKELLKKNPC